MKCDRCGIEVYPNQRYGRLFDATTGGPHYCRTLAPVMPEYRECWCGRPVIDVDGQRLDPNGLPHSHTGRPEAVDTRPMTPPAKSAWSPPPVKPGGNPARALGGVEV